MQNSIFKCLNLLKLVIILSIFALIGIGCGGGGGEGVAPITGGETTPIPTWYKDADGDGYSDGTTQTSKTRPSNIYYKASELTATSGDCNDNDFSIHPGVNEVCSDSKDNNCDGKSDEGCCIISYYVSLAGDDSYNCLSPETPCKTIQHAIDYAYGTETCPVIIHVAAGTYNEHLVMDSWESLEGGWNSDFTQQWDFENDGLKPDPEYATIIDGDDNGTCITQLEVNDANINGLTIQNGNGIAGGIYFDNSSPNVTNCTIKNNFGREIEDRYSAGGMYNHYSSPTVVNCSFIENDTQGGPFDSGLSVHAVLNDHSQAKFIKCTFTDPFFNATLYENAMVNIYSSSWILYENLMVNVYSSSWIIEGNAMVNVYSSPIISECRFENNGSGNYVYGPLVNLNSSPIITHCSFLRNRISENGGSAMFNSGSTVMIINSEFIGNENYTPDGGRGVLIDNYSSECTIVNCSFGDNRALVFGWVGWLISSAYNSHTIVKNSIIWDNIWYLDDPQRFGSIDVFGIDESSTLEVSNCDIDQDGFVGINGNIRENPMFYYTGWDDNGTPDYPYDDVWVGGDYHLQTGSPCINTGDNFALPSDTTDLDNDGDMAEPIPLDLDGNPRIIDGVVDMGAYE